MDPNKHRLMEEAGNDGSAGGSAGNSGGGTALAGDTGGGAPNAPAFPLEALPEEFRAHTALAPHVKDGKVDVSGLAKSFVNAQSLVGADKIVLPKPDAPREEWNTVFEKLGRPKEPKGYELPTKFDDAPAFEADDATRDFFGQTFHELGLSKTQANELMKRYAKWSDGKVAEAKHLITSTKETEAKLVREAFGTAEADEIAVAKQAVDWVESAVPGFKEFLNKTGMGDRAAMIKAFNKIGHAMSEDVLGPAVRRDGGGRMTPAAAKAEISELQRDPAYRGEGAKKDPRKHREIIERIAALSEMADPDARVLISRHDRAVGVQ